MDWECLTCGTQMPGVPIRDHRFTATTDAPSQVGYPPGCPNPACQNNPRSVTMVWAKRINA